MNDTLTGNEDTDRLILLNLSDKKLFRVCQLNTYTTKLCNNGFWMTRFEQKFGANLGKGNTINYRDNYKKYSKLKDRPELLELAIQNHHNDLAILIINKYTIPAFKKQNNENLKISMNYYFILVCRFDNFPIFMIFYEIGEEFNINFDTQKILMVAAKFGSYAIVKFILDVLKYTPYDPTLYDFYDQDAYAKEVKIIKSAGKSNNLSVVRLLHDHKFPLPSSLFFSAIKNGNIDMIKYLIDEQAPFPTLEPEDNETGYYYKFKWMIGYLVRLGRRVLTYMNDNGYDVVNIPFILTEALLQKQEKVIKWLIDHGANVEDPTTL